MTAIPEKTLTLDEYWALLSLPENQDKKLELVDGVIVEVGSSFLPSHIAIRIAYFIMAYLMDTPIGYVTGADGGYKLAERKVLIPDVGYIAKARLPDPPDRYVPIPPDWAIEVISPTDDRHATPEKALDYLAHGTQLVWIVNPPQQTVTVYRPGDTSEQAMLQRFGVDDTLEGDPVLPGFTLAVASIFAVG